MLMGTAYDLVAISIHAPREGGDDDSGVVAAITNLISIHAPREGGDAEIVAVHAIDL